MKKRSRRYIYNVFAAHRMGSRPAPAGRSFDIPFPIHHHRITWCWFERVQSCLTYSTAVTAREATSFSLVVYERSTSCTHYSYNPTHKTLCALCVVHVLYMQRYWSSLHTSGRFCPTALRIGGDGIRVGCKKKKGVAVKRVNAVLSSLIKSHFSPPHTCKSTATQERQKTQRDYPPCVLSHTLLALSPYTTSPHKHSCC